MNYEKSIKINIGSGPTGKADWINLDWGILPFLGKLSWLAKFLIKVGLLPRNYATNWPKSLRLVDCRKRLPFKNNSVDFIYTGHFIEHLYYYQVVSLMKECRRILRPGGILRISIPDIKVLSEKYLNGDRDFFVRLEDSNNKGDVLENIADLFVQHIYGYDSWSSPSFFGKIQRLFIRGHLWMYDYESLSTILKRTGFSNIQRQEACIGRMPDIDFLDIHKSSSLFIEAVK